MASVEFQRPSASGHTADALVDWLTEGRSVEPVARAVPDTALFLRDEATTMGFESVVRHGRGLNQG